MWLGMNDDVKLQCVELEGKISLVVEKEFIERVVMEVESVIVVVCGCCN